MKILRLIGRCIIILCLPVMLLSGSLAWGFNSTWIIEYGFNKYDVAETTQLSGAELTDIARDWVRYINSADQLWRISLERKGNSFELFSPEEQIHFRDVKQLIRLDYLILIATLFLVLIYALISVFCRQGRYRRQLAVTFLLGCALTFLLLILSGIASLLAFDQLFIQLHHLIFTNPYWSAEGYMLMLFPGGFWFDAAMICVAFMAGVTLVLCVGSILYLRRPKIQVAGRT